MDAIFPGHSLAAGCALAPSVLDATWEGKGKPTPNGSANGRGGALRPCRKGCGLLRAC
jgi:hypothetical protein